MAEIERDEKATLLELFHRRHVLPQGYATGEHSVGGCSLPTTRRPGASPYRTPGYPGTPLVYIVVLLGFLVNAVVYQPVETLIGGLSLSATGVFPYGWL